MLLLVHTNILLGLLVLFVQCYNSPSDLSIAENTTQRPLRWRLIWSSDPSVKYSSEITNFTFLPIENGTSAKNISTEIPLITSTEETPTIQTKDFNTFSISIVFIIIITMIIIIILLRRYLNISYKIIQCINN